MDPPGDQTEIRVWILGQGERARVQLARHCEKFVVGQSERLEELPPLIGVTCRDLSSLHRQPERLGYPAARRRFHHQPALTGSNLNVPKHTHIFQR